MICAWLLLVALPLKKKQKGGLSYFPTGTDHTHKTTINQVIWITIVRNVLDTLPSESTNLQAGRNPNLVPVWSCPSCSPDRQPPRTWLSCCRSESGKEQTLLVCNVGSFTLFSYAFLGTYNLYQFILNRFIHIVCTKLNREVQQSYEIPQNPHLQNLWLGFGLSMSQSYTFPIALCRQQEDRTSAYTVR